MINIYTLSSTFYIFCMTTAIILFIASSLLYYFLMPQQEFRHLGRKCLEGSNLVVLLAIATILHEVFEDGASGILYIEAMDVWRYGIILISLISTLYMMYDRHAGGPVPAHGFISSSPGIRHVASLVIATSIVMHCSASHPGFPSSIPPIPGAADGPFHPVCRRFSGRRSPAQSGKRRTRAGKLRHV